MNRKLTLRLGTVAWATAFAASAIGQYQYMVYVGPTELGDYCGYNLNTPGGHAGLGTGGGVPPGRFAYPSCGTQLGTLDCQSSPFSMGWFDPGPWNGMIMHFHDSRCCDGSEIRKKYVVFVGNQEAGYSYTCAAP